MAKIFHILLFQAKKTKRMLYGYWQRIAVQKRPSPLRLSLIVAMAISTNITVSVPVAFACTPPIGGHPISTVAERTNQADMVFEGIVTDHSSDYHYTATISVVRYFKGSGSQTLLIGPYGSSALCLQEATIGGRYIFYANGDPAGPLQASYIGTKALDSPDNDTVSEIIATTEHHPVSPIGEVYWLYLPLIMKQ